MARFSKIDRNWKGCFIILGVLALFLALYLLVGLEAKPQNTVASKIQTMPTGGR